MIRLTLSEVQRVCHRPPKSNVASTMSHVASQGKVEAEGGGRLRKFSKILKFDFPKTAPGRHRIVPALFSASGTPHEPRCGPSPPPPRPVAPAAPPHTGGAENRYFEIWKIFRSRFSAARLTQLPLSPVRRRSTWTADDGLVVPPRA